MCVKKCVLSIFMLLYMIQPRFKKKIISIINSEPVLIDGKAHITSVIDSSTRVQLLSIRTGNAPVFMLPFGNTENNASG